MKLIFLFVYGLLLLLAVTPARAITDTWDGGGADNNLSTNLNWVDNTSPASDLALTDLIFAAAVRLTPNVSTVFSTNSVTFNNTAGAFSIGGSTLNVGAGGITNNDTDTQTFSTTINLVGTATTTFSATSGALSFGTVGLGANTLNFAATTGTSSLTALTGSGTLNKSGAGTLSFGAAGAVTQAWDLAESAGSFTVNAATDLTVSTTGSITVSGATFSANGNVTMDATAFLLSGGSSIFSVASGKTLTLQNGGSLTATGTNLLHNSQGTVTATGSGSLVNAATGGLVVNGSGSTLNVLAGADATFVSMTVGGSGTSTVLFDGAGSTATGTSNSTSVGNGGTGLLTFSNGATGALGVVNLATSAASNGTFSILSGADVTASSLMMVDDSIATESGTLTVNGAGSSFTINGAGAAFIGAASLSTAGVNVQNSGVFNTGTGLMTVNATGSISITGGTLNANGNTTVNGLLTRDATGVLTLAQGKTLTLQNGGDAFLTGSYATGTTAANGGNITATGVGSTFQTSGALTVASGSALNALSGGSVSSSSALNVGTNGAGALTVDGAGSFASAGSVSTWGAGSAAIVTFANGATGSFFGGMALASSALPGTSAAFSILSGASVTTTSLNMATAGGGSSASLTIDGAGSAMTLGGSSIFNLGFTNLAPATLTLQNGGTFNSGTGLAAITPTGAVAINGGIYNSNGNLTLSGGQLTRNGAGTLTLALGTSMTVQGGGDATISGLFQQLNRANLTVTGSGSTFTTTGDFQWESANNTLSLLSVNNGGLLASGGSLHLGRNDTAVSLTASGAGTQLNASPFFTSEWQAGVTLTTGATATLGGLKIADSPFGSASFGSLTVQSGATASIGNLSAGSVITQATAEITVEGIGSAITQTGASTLTLGAAFVTTASLSVNDGGTFTSGTGSFTLNATGTMNIGGGTATIKGPLTDNGGAVNFTSGALLFTHPSVNLTVGNNGLLGSNLTLDAGKRLELPGTTTVEAFRTFSVDGGIFRTGALTNNGTLDFRRGTLGITGAGGFTIGGGGALGSNVTLGSGANFQITNALDAVLGSTFTLDGGTLSSGSYTNVGTARFNLGTATCGSFSNLSSGRVFLGDTLNITAGNFTNGGNSRLTMEGGILLAPTLSNAGLVSGSGTLGAPLTNQAGGEIRAQAGQTLYFEGTPNTNSGRCNLQGGALYFTAPLSNSASGQINGAGILSFPSSTVPSTALPLGGLNNSGQINLSGGDSLIFGTIAMNTGSKLIASGGAVATFFDVFRHAGAEVKASAGSALVFFGEVRGAGSFTGTGIIYMEGGYSPGSSPASVSLAPQIVFTESNTLIMEIGGLTAGTQHDKLTFTHAAAPQVTWGGTLAVTLVNGFTPAAGNVFDVLDFDNTLDASTFVTIALPALPAGLAWDSSQLYSDGTLRVSSTVGLTFAQWATNVLGDPAATATGDHDHDGIANAIEFALGLFPAQPGTVVPTIDLHTYADGDSLRARFTRPLDRTGVTLTIEASPDLLNWTDLATSVNSAPFTGPGFVSENRSHPLDEPGFVEIRDTVPTSTGPRRLMRFRVTLTP